MNPITLKGPEDIVAALPYQLGYHPRDSIVVVALRRRAVGLVQRVDLPPPEHCAEAVAAMIPPLLREKPDGVLLVGYEERKGDALPVLEALREAVPEHDVTVIEALVVRDRRWYAPWCDGDCCPSEGLPVAGEGGTPAVAEFVGLEVSPLPDRAGLAWLLSPESPELVAAVAEELEQLESTGEPALSPAAAALWARVCDVGPSRPAVEGLAPAELALLAHSLTDVNWRDGLIAWIAPGTLPLDALDPVLVQQLKGSLPTPSWSGLAPGEDADVVIAGRRLETRLTQLCRLVPGQPRPGAADRPGQLHVVAR